MRKLLLLTITVFAGGCATTMSDERLVAMTDRELCDAIAAEPFNVRYMAFMRGRGLFCHPDQISCTKAGFEPETDTHRDCAVALLVQRAQRQEEKRAAWDRAVQSLKNAGPVTTHCYGGPNSATCTTY